MSRILEGIPAINWRSAILASMLIGCTGWAETIDPVIERAPVWNVRTGQEKIIWKRTFEGWIGSASLNVSDERVLVYTNRVGAAGMAALDADGNLLWEARHLRLKVRVHDIGWGLGSTPYIEGERAYYVSNRGELVAVDTEGFRNGENAGPFKDEAEPGDNAPDYVWMLDMMAEFGVFKRDASDAGNPISSPVVLGDLVYCVTGHGVRPMRRAERQRADAKAPSFLAVNKLTGKVAWTSNAPGDRIIYGQWSSPVVARVGEQNEVIFPGGDGVLYGFEPVSGKLKWSFDCNVPGAIDPFEASAVDYENERHHFFGKPMVAGNVLYVALNHDLEVPVKAPLRAIQLDAGGEKPKQLWEFGPPEFKGTYTAAAAHRDVVFVTAHDCVVYAIDAKTGEKLWDAQIDFAHDRSLSGDPVVHEEKLYVPGSMSVTVFEAAREKKCLGRYEFESWYPSTPHFSGGRMYMTAGDAVYALETVR